MLTKLFSLSGCERHLSRHHDVQDNAHTPHIGSARVILLAHVQLWSHEGRCSNHIGTLVLRRKLDGAPKITQFQPAIFLKKDIIRFDVSVRDLIVMTVPDCFCQLPKKELGNRLA